MADQFQQFNKLHGLVEYGKEPPQRVVVDDATPVADGVEHHKKPPRLNLSGVDQLEEAVDTLAEGIAVFDPDHKIIFANAPYLDAFATMARHFVRGTSLDQALLRHLQKVFPDMQREEAQEELAEIMAKRAAGEPWDVFGEDGRIYEVRNHIMANGNHATVCVDTTELREQAAELKAARMGAITANRAKSAFLANMSHEIRTPLNGIMGMAQAMALGDLTDEQKLQVDAILDSGQTLTKILNDVLDLSKVEAEHLEIVRGDADLGELLDQTEALWSAQAEAKGLTLTFRRDPHMAAHFDMDALRIGQCVNNLVSNAIKFTAKGGVTVTAGVEPAPADTDGGAHNLITITVKDTGPGMNAASLKRLFQPFVQGDETISRLHGGTGLGLSLSRRLARLHGGDVTVQSAPGEGAVFTLTFVAALAQETTQEEEGPSAADLSRVEGRVILVTDDNAINRKVAGHFLRPLRVTVLEAENGLEALKVVEDNEVDLILLDIHMPVLSGPETLERLDARSVPRPPVIALTADAMAGDREKYLSLGVEDYVSKPMDINLLHAAIARVFAGAPDAEAPPGAIAANVA